MSGLAMDPVVVPPSPPLGVRAIRSITLFEGIALSAVGGLALGVALLFGGIVGAIYFPLAIGPFMAGLVAIFLSWGMRQGVIGAYYATLAVHALLGLGFAFLLVVSFVWDIEARGRPSAYWPVWAALVGLQATTVGLGIHGLLVANARARADMEKLTVQD